MRLRRGKVIATAVGPYGIVCLNAFFNQPAGIIKAQAAAIEVELIFYNAIHSLGQGIFIGVAFFSHANRYIITIQQAGVFLAAILAAPVGVMDQFMLLILPVLQSHFKGFYTTLCQHIASKGIAHYLTGICIGYHA